MIFSRMNCQERIWPRRTGALRYINLADDLLGERRCL